MRELLIEELSYVSGGTSLENMSGWDMFWTSYAGAAGVSAGVVSGPFLAVGAGVGAALYYLIYTPLYYIAYAGYVVASSIASGIYQGGAAVKSMLAG
ncbi:MAG: hypothetical protein AB7V32_03620 [Candidatus Berkiella sp.]